MTEKMRPSGSDDRLSNMRLALTTLVAIFGCSTPADPRGPEPATRAVETADAVVIARVFINPANPRAVMTVEQVLWGAVPYTVELPAASAPFTSEPTIYFLYGAAPGWTVARQGIRAGLPGSEVALVIEQLAPRRARRPHPADAIARELASDLAILRAPVTSDPGAHAIAEHRVFDRLPLPGLPVARVEQLLGVHRDGDGGWAVGTGSTPGWSRMLWIERGIVVSMSLEPSLLEGPTL